MHPVLQQQWQDDRVLVVTADLYPSIARHAGREPGLKGSAGMKGSADYTWSLRQCEVGNEGVVDSHADSGLKRVTSESSNLNTRTVRNFTKVLFSTTTISYFSLTTNDIHPA